MTRLINTLPSGNVEVLTHIEGTTAVERREYCQHGAGVHLLRHASPPLRVCRGLHMTGKPLAIGDGERLEAAVRRELEAASKPRLADWLARLERPLELGLFALFVVVGLAGMVCGLLRAGGFIA